MGNNGKEWEIQLQIQTGDEQKGHPSLGFVNIIPIFSNWSNFSQGRRRLLVVSGFSRLVKDHHLQSDI